MTHQAQSIRKRLLLWITIPILLVSALIMVLAFAFSWHEIEEVYDAQLVHTAKTLIQITAQETREGGMLDITLDDEKPYLQHRYENKTAFRIWQGDKLALQSAKAHEFPSSLEAPPGFSKQEIREKPWRFFVYIDPVRDLKIETSQRYAIRYELIGQLLLSLIIPMSILIPSLLAIVWVGIRKSLKPLTALSRTVDTRDSEDLSPIDIRDVPAEAMSLALALNRLFARIGESFRREREFTDHAAHELRTPMAAMKTQTQVLLRKAAAMPECRDGLNNLMSVIDRSTHLVEQLLSIARLQNENIPLSAIDLSDIVRDAVSDMEPLAKEKHQTLSSQINEHILITGHADSLYIMIRNLLDNAIKYTPEGGHIDVSAGQDAVLKITDTGSGIADEDKRSVFQRFKRADHSGQTGSGLGLSIVDWIACAHGALLNLKDNTPTGLIVEVRFKR